MTLKDSIVASCQKMCDTDHNFFPESGGVKGKKCCRVFIHGLFMVAGPPWGLPGLPRHGLRKSPDRAAG
jgi:hypothetical protein